MARKLNVVSIRLSADDLRYIDGQPVNRCVFIRQLIHQHQEHKAAQPLIRELRQLLANTSATPAAPRDDQERALRLIEDIFSKGDTA